MPTSSLSSAALVNLFDCARERFRLAALADDKRRAFREGQTCAAYATRQAALWRCYAQLPDHATD